MLCCCTFSLRKWLHLKLFVQVKLSVALPGTAHDKSLAWGHLCHETALPNPKPTLCWYQQSSLTPGTTKKFPSLIPCSCGSEDSTWSRVSERWLTRWGGTYLQSLNLDKRRRQERVRSWPGDFSPPQFPAVPWAHAAQTWCSRCKACTFCMGTIPSLPRIPWCY